MTAAQWQEVLCRVRSLSAADKDRLLTYLYALHDKPQQPMNTESTPETQPYTASSSETMKAVRELHLSILNAPSPIEVDGVYRVMLETSPPFGTLAGCRVSGKNVPGGSARHRPSNSDRNTL